MLWVDKKVSYCKQVARRSVFLQVKQYKRIVVGSILSTRRPDQMVGSVVEGS